MAAPPGKESQRRQSDPNRFDFWEKWGICWAFVTAATMFGSIPIIIKPGYSWVFFAILVGGAILSQLESCWLLLRFIVGFPVLIFYDLVCLPILNFVRSFRARSRLGASGLWPEALPCMALVK